MTARQKRLLHYAVSIPGTLVFVLWLTSGAAMVFDSIRGSAHASPKTPRVTDLRDLALTPAQLAAHVRGPVSRIVLVTIGDHAYAQVTTSDRTALIDATSGAVLSPIDEPTARRLLTGYEGMPPLHVEKIVSRDYEYRYGELPAWRGEFADGRILHIAASTGEIQSWSDREGMIIRAMYYWFHTFQLTGSAAINATIAFVAIAWGALSVLSGLVLYRRAR